MPKIQFSDVVPPDRRSIRNIPISTTSRNRISSPLPPPPTPPRVVERAPEPAPENRPTEEYYFQEKPPSSPRRKKLFFVAGTAILIAIFAIVMMTVFASASITVFPKKEVVALDFKVPGSLETGTGKVHYEMLRLSKSKEVKVKATGEEMIERKASGMIVIYNNFSKDPQRLISRTRFETEAGLVYRIPESVVVPGKTIKDGKEVAGTIEVKVFADEAGEKYNIAKTDFKIPGFKNDSQRYSTIYARGSTVMEGGLVGKVKTVVQAEKDAALATLETEIKSELEKELTSKIPDGLVSLKNSIEYKFKELEQKDSDDSVTFVYEGTANILLIQKADLSKTIFDTYLKEKSDWQGIEAEVGDWQTLEIASALPSDTAENIEIAIKGNATMLAKIDQTLIKEKLVGQDRKNVTPIMQTIPSIDRVQATIRPLWKKSFPDNIDKIYVDTNLKL